jgi:hypothetical protein
MDYVFTSNAVDDVIMWFVRVCGSTMKVPGVSLRRGISRCFGRSSALKAALLAQAILSSDIVNDIL